MDARTQTPRIRREPLRRHYHDVAIEVAPAAIAAGIAISAASQHVMNGMKNNALASAKALGWMVAESEVSNEQDTYSTSVDRNAATLWSRYRQLHAAVHQAVAELSRKSLVAEHEKEVVIALWSHAAGVCIALLDEVRHEAGRQLSSELTTMVPLVITSLLNARDRINRNPNVELANRRKAARTSVRVPASAIVNGKTMRVVITDISATGLGLANVSTGAPGDDIRILLADDTTLAGTVRWQQRGLAGIELDPDRCVIERNEKRLGLEL